MNTDLESKWIHLHCACGDVFDLNKDARGANLLRASFWSAHSGRGHKVTETNIEDME